ncbi:MAG: pyridoxamine 5'-phosphate oxidase family protein [Erysipelotrichaceae bacterium]|nr:pyridoxamine 5'-phosphate oxidase family protein [Erysipelotrichaceae bacterium]
MTNVEKVSEYLDKAKVFYFLTTDGDQPKGRPFGFHLIYQGKLYFGCGTFKNVFRQLSANPKVEVLACMESEFLRYDGRAVIVRDEDLLEAVRQAAPQIMGLYDANGWEMGMFYLENGHAEIRGLFELKEEFDV